MSRARWRGGALLVRGGGIPSRLFARSRPPRPLSSGKFISNTSKKAANASRVAWQGKVMSRARWRGGALLVRKLAANVIVRVRYEPRSLARGCFIDKAAAAVRPQAAARVAWQGKVMSRARWRGGALLVRKLAANVIVRVRHEPRSLARGCFIGKAAAAVRPQAAALKPENIKKV